eukprot:scaffold1766_cov401-Prasinococcus_capsulatus_cf.AAC.26
MVWSERRRRGGIEQDAWSGVELEGGGGSAYAAGASGAVRCAVACSDGYKRAGSGAPLQHSWWAAEAPLQLSETQPAPGPLRGQDELLRGAHLVCSVELQ